MKKQIPTQLPQAFSLCSSLLLWVQVAFGQQTPPAQTFLWQNSAYAFFNSTNPANECVLTSVTVQGGFNQQGQNENSASGQWMEINVQEFDVCNGIVVVDADGPATNASVTIDANLKTARLLADVPCIDEVNGVPFTAHVDITFSGSGQLFPWTGNSQDNSAPGIKIIVQATGQARNAQASGVVSVSDFPAYVFAAPYMNTPNLISGPSFEGAIQKMNSASITIIGP